MHRCEPHPIDKRGLNGLSSSAGRLGSRLIARRVLWILDLTCLSLWSFVHRGQPAMSLEKGTVGLTFQGGPNVNRGCEWGLRGLRADLLRRLERQ